MCGRGPRAASRLLGTGRLEDAASSGGQAVCSATGMNSSGEPARAPGPTSAQRLERDQLGGPQAEDRLVVQAQLVAGQGAPQPGLERVVRPAPRGPCRWPRPRRGVALDQRRELPGDHPVAVDGVAGPAPAGPPRSGPRARRRCWLASSTRPSASSASSGTRPRRIQRRRRGGRRAALEVLRELAADRGEHRRPSGLGSVTPCE